jgi:hypothetical protein
MNKYIITIIISIILLYNPTISFASNFDLSVSPQIFQIELTPPAAATATKTITLENSGLDPLPLTIQYKFFKPEGNNGDITYLPPDIDVGNDPLILKKIALLDKGEEVTSLTIPPKTKKQFDLAIGVPKDEPPGDYYFSMLFLTEDSTASQSAKSSQSHAIGGIAMNVLLSIGPKSKTTGSIEEFSTPFFQTKGPVNFTVKIKNSSSHFIYPKGQILITNMFGQKIGKIDLLPLNILSNSSRSLPSREQFANLQTLEDAKSGKKTVDKDTLKALTHLANMNQAIAIWPEKFLLGPYKATLTIALSEEGPLYVKSIHFVGLPIAIITAFIICIILVAAIRARLNHRNRQSKT